MQGKKAYQYQAVSARASRYAATTHQEPPLVVDAYPQARRQGCALTTYFVTGMALMLGLYLIGNFYVVPFVQALKDHWMYGQAHISQLDTTIAGTPYRCIAQDMHGKIIIIELDRDSPLQSKLFVAPGTVDGDTRVVTLTVAYVNGDGLPDLVISVQGQASEMMLYGSKSGFSWTEPR